MDEKKQLSPDSVKKEYSAGLKFNTGVDLYDNVETNENFFIGKQWEGVEANGLPTPVFNFLKRVVLFCIANVCTDNLKIHASPMAAYPMGDHVGEFFADALNSEFEALAEFNSLTALVREFARNAAVDGDGCMYTYWDPDVETGQSSKGAIRTEILQNTQVMFGNPNCRDVQKQPWILIERRMLVKDARKRAKAFGCDGESIISDRKENGQARLDQLGGDKVTVLLRLWKDEDTGTVWGYECTQTQEIRKPFDLRIKLYPICWMNWDYIQDCYHGQAMITGLIPNQIFVNKLYAMSMISLMSLAYPKVVFDKTRIAHWSSKPGHAIAVGGPVEGVAKIMGPAAISPQISQFIELAVSDTQRFLGATDIAMGDSRPDNATAIIALQRAAATPMELTKQNIIQALEDLGRIYMEFERTCYGTRMINLRMEDGDVKVPALVNFNLLSESAMSIKLDVGAASYWSEIATMQTLDNLLLQGRISTVEYLKRLPAGQITDRDGLIAALNLEEQMGISGEAPAATGQQAPSRPELTGGSGDSALTRAVRETGAVPGERGA